MAKVTQLDDRSVQEMYRLFRKVDTLSGDGVINTRTKITIKRSGRGGSGRRGGAQIKGAGQLQGQHFIMRTNNVPGWDFDFFTPPH